MMAAIFGKDSKINSIPVTLFLVKSKGEPISNRNPQQHLLTPSNKTKIQWAIVFRAGYLFVLIERIDVVKGHPGNIKLASIDYAEIELDNRAVATTEEKIQRVYI
jgi:hypothetical protein